jgi:predicted dehydrogenase
VQDVRVALEDKDLDVISIATCNHWHSLMSIWACQAGKDVYVEKPLSHNVFEGRKLVEAARKYGRIVQHGTQSRSSGGWASAAAVARSGKAGKLKVSYGWASKPRGGIGSKGPEDAPDGLDFNVWLGPAPDQYYHGNLVHYNWHWFWDFGNADTGNQGVHQMDIARWGLPEDAVAKPIKVISLGGRFDWDDQGETPNAHLTIFDYGDYQLVFESCNLVTGKTRTVTNAFHTDQGVITSGRFTPHGSKKSEGLPKVEVDMGAGGGIFENFVKAVRSRKHTDLQADVLDGHLSSLLCHVGAICYRLGEVVPFDKSRKAFGDSKVAYDALMQMEGRMKSRGVKFDDSLRYRIGPVLTFDQKTEKFTGDRADEANRLISRRYREPFVVPDKV